MSKFAEAKKAKQETYERLCRTPGTPQHAARQQRLNDRTEQLLREQEAARRADRLIRAVDALEAQRRVIKSLQH